MALRIKIDKEYTRPSQVAKVKEDIRDFSDGMTVNDLLAHFLSSVNRDLETFDRHVRYYEISAFPGGWAYDDITSYSVGMLVECWKKIYKVHFYIDQDWKVNTERMMWTITTYGIESER